MALPESLRVKLSSEAAEYVALTPVVARELPFIELLEHIVSATGPDAARARDILKRGTLVSGATRFRWQGWECDHEDLHRAIGALPQPEPARTFVAERCSRVILTGPAARIELGRETAERRRLFRKRSFWQCLMETASAPVYVTYLYKDHADHYRVELSPEARNRLKADAALLKFDGLTRHVQRTAFERMELIVSR